MSVILSLQSMNEWRRKKNLFQAEVLNGKSAFHSTDMLMKDVAPYRALCKWLLLLLFKMTFFHLVKNEIHLLTHVQTYMSKTIEWISKPNVWWLNQIAKFKSTGFYRTIQFQTRLPYSLMANDVFVHSIQWLLITTQSCASSCLIFSPLYIRVTTVHNTTNGILFANKS